MNAKERADEPRAGDGKLIHDPQPTPEAFIANADAESAPVPAPDASGLQTPSKRYKRPESVLVVIFTLGGEFLLLRRTRPNSFWQSVTGSLRPGEGVRAAALRELREETGLSIAPSRLLDLRHSERFPILPAWRARYAPGVHHNREHWFALPLPERRLIRLNPQEHLEYRWLRPRPAAARASSWTNRNAILAIAESCAFLPPIFWAASAPRFVPNQVARSRLTNQGDQQDH